MEGVTSSIMDRSLIIGAILLGIAILSGIFHFLRLGLFSAGLEKNQANIVSAAILVAAGIFVCRELFS
ncbi:MAG: hypothetical protein ACOY46_09870 [Bacillota bacterium]